MLRVARVIGLAVAVLVLGSTAWGQRRGGPQMDQLPQLSVDGTIEDLGGMQLQVKAADQSWVLQISPKAKFEVTGKAKAEALAPGMCVEFVAMIEPRTGKIDEKVSRLVICTPDQQRPIGAFAGQTLSVGEKKEGGKEAAKPAFGPQPFGPAAPAGDMDTGAKGRKGRTARGAPAAPQSFLIRGQVTGVKSGKVYVSCPNTQVKPALSIEVADDAEIDVEVSGATALNFIRVGDQITAKGRQMSQKGGFIEEATVTMVNPLAAPEAPGKHRAPAKAGAKGKKPAEKEDAAEEKPGEEKKPAAEEESPDMAKKPAKKPAKGKAKEKEEPQEKEEK